MKLVTKEELLLLLSTVVSDLKHAPTKKLQKVNNKNIRREMYAYCVRTMFEENRFKYIEGRDLYIKGHVRDVWKYLDKAYKLVHGINFKKYIGWSDGKIIEHCTIEILAENICKEVDKDILEKLSRSAGTGSI